MNSVAEKVYTTEEVAEMYGVKVITVWDWIRKGKLRALNISSKSQPRYRIKQSHIDKFEKARESR